MLRFIISPLANHLDLKIGANSYNLHDRNNECIKSYRITPLRLILEGTLCTESERSIFICISRNSINDRSGNRNTSTPICNFYSFRTSLLDKEVSRINFQEVILAERIECSKHLITCVDFELATSHGRELVVDQ